MEQEKKIYIVAVKGDICYAYQQLRDDAKFIENVFQVASQNLFRRGIDFCRETALLELHVPAKMLEKVWLSNISGCERFGAVIDKCYNGEEIHELLYHNVEENLTLFMSSCETENFLLPYPEVELSALDISMLTCLTLQIRNFYDTVL